jgi:hypothetical protein
MATLLSIGGRHAERACYISGRALRALAGVVKSPNGTTPPGSSSLSYAFAGRDA